MEIPPPMTTPPTPSPPKKQRNKKIEFFTGLYCLVELFLLLFRALVPTCRNQYFFVLQGIMARVYETFVVLILLAVLVTSIVWVGLALVDRGRTSDEGKQCNLMCDLRCVRLD